MAFNTFCLVAITIICFAQEVFPTPVDLNEIDNDLDVMEFESKSARIMREKQQNKVPKALPKLTVPFKCGQKGAPPVCLCFNPQCHCGQKNRNQHHPLCTCQHCIFKCPHCQTNVTTTEPQEPNWTTQEADIGDTDWTPEQNSEDPAFEFTTLPFEDSSPKTRQQSTTLPHNRQQNKKRKKKSTTTTPFETTTELFETTTFPNDINGEKSYDTKKKPNCKRPINIYPISIMFPHKKYFDRAVWRQLANYLKKFSQGDSIAFVRAVPVMESQRNKVCECPARREDQDQEEMETVKIESRE